VSTAKKEERALNNPSTFKNVNLSNGEVNISHENTTIVVWIYDGI